VVLTAVPRLGMSESVHARSSRFELRANENFPSLKKAQSAFRDLSTWPICNETEPPLPGMACRSAAPSRPVPISVPIAPILRGGPREIRDAAIWVPVSEAAGGSERLRVLEDHLGASDPIACDDFRCYFSRIGSDWVSKASILASCASFKVGDVYSAPDCRPLAFREAGESWVLALVGRYGEDEGHYGPPLGASQFPTGVSGGLPSDLEIRRAVAEALTTPQVSLSLASIPVPNRIVAGIDGRVSTILAPLRETVTVDVEMVHSDFGDNVVGLWPEIRLYVNRYNTDDPKDWHLPSVREDDTYRRAILLALKKKLATLCRNAQTDPSSDWVKCPAKSVGSP